MTALERNYTSTSSKFLQHMPVLEYWRTQGFVQPISIHIMPTSRCNLKCVMCSVANRPKEDLDFDLIVDVINKLHEIGLKSIVFSGGGEPLLYQRFNQVLAFLNDYYNDIDIGIITNGILLNTIDLSQYKSIGKPKFSLLDIRYIY